MSRRSTSVYVFVALLLGAVFVTGTASALSVTVAESGSDITIEVTEEGEPIPGANVTVSGVTEETPLDGEYTTDENGRVTFSEEKTSDLSGVIHLRITVDSDVAYKSVLTTVTRGPEAGSSPMGHRMSMSLQEPVSTTHGKIVGRLNAAEGGSGVRATAKRTDELLTNLSDTQLRREVLGRDLAAGEITAPEYYLKAVKNARRAATIRGALRENVELLNGYSDERLRDEGVDASEVESLYESIRRGIGINTDVRLLDEE